MTCFMKFTRLNETTCRDDLARGRTSNVLAGTCPVKWFDPVNGDGSDRGTQGLTAGDKTFTKPGGIGCEAVLYMAATQLNL
jgi:hypothetical protein